MGMGGAMGKLRDGVAEIHEYEELGAPHDTQLFRLAGLIGSKPDARPAWAAALIWTENSYANGAYTQAAGLQLLYCGDEEAPEFGDYLDLTHGPRMSMETFGEGLLVWSKSDTQLCRAYWQPGMIGADRSCIEL